MFRRTKPAESPVQPRVETVVVKADGKGRPTPSRREAEAAGRARAKGVLDKKQAARKLKEGRAERNSRVRAGMRSGDERYLQPRDQGKVRRFIRDMVDGRLSMAEFLLPMLLIIMLLQTLGYQSLSNGLWSTTILLVVLDTTLLMFKLRRELKKRFPEESTKGTAFYAVLRALQLRFLRQPKPQVKLGQRLPERY